MGAEASNPGGADVEYVTISFGLEDGVGGLDGEFSSSKRKYFATDPASKSGDLSIKRRGSPLSKAFWAAVAKAVLLVHVSCVVTEGNVPVRVLKVVVRS